MALLSDAAFWQALADFAWPAVVLAVAVMFRQHLAQLAGKEKLHLKVAGMEISVAEATEQAGKGVSDLQERVATLEARLKRAPQQSLEAAVHLPPKGSQGREALTLLWVDDHPSNNAFIIEKLELDGIRVRKEISTSAALKVLTRDRIDLLITDLGRHENGRENVLAGLELLEEMNRAGLRVPALVFASQRAVVLRDRLEAAGAETITSSAVDVFAFVDRHKGS